MVVCVAVVPGEQCGCGGQGRWCCGEALVGVSLLVVGAGAGACPQVAVGAGVEFGDCK